jgi:hypothetical protein
MDEKNEKVAKIDFPKPADPMSYGGGCGLVRRWPPATFKSDFS